MKTNSYFINQAANLVSELNKGTSEEEIAVALQCLYIAGVVDAGNYTTQQKMEMLQTIKNKYSIQEN